MNNFVESHDDHNHYHHQEDQVAGHKCIHNELMAAEKTNTHPRGIFSTMESSFKLQAQHNLKRSILQSTATTATETWSNIRVLFRTDYLGPDSDTESRSCKAVGDYYWTGANTPTSTKTQCLTDSSSNCWRVCKDTDVIDSSFLSEIVSSMLPTIKEDYSRMLQVPTVKDGDYPKIFNANSRCGSQGGVAVPSDIIANGLDGKNADAIFFVTSRPTETGVLGWAIPCILDSITKRPLVAQLNISPKLGNYTKEKLSVVRHEALHALGFSNSFLSSFYDRANKKTLDASAVYSVVNKSFVDSTGTTQSVSVTKLKTPKILEVARKYYNCPTLDGVPMEEYGGSGSAVSHWEKSIMKNELMVASVSGELVLSSFTIAYFEDSGWYRGNFSHAQRLTWGKDMGCAMANYRCENWPTKNVGYFCSSESPSKSYFQTTSTSSCTHDLKSKSYCNSAKYYNDLGYYEHFPSSPKQGGTDSFMDYCPFQIAFTDGNCVSGYPIKTSGEEFGSSSACFEASISLTSNSDIKTADSRCLKYSCGNETLNIYVGSKKFSCPKDQTAQTKYDSTFFGYVKCPLNGYDILCTNSKATASNNAINGTYVKDGEVAAEPTCDGITASSPLVCNRRGKCISNNNCQCFTGAFGDQCLSYTCDSISSSNSSVCSGQGTCDGLDNCNCYAGHYGDYCENFLCFGYPASHSSVCSSNGQCVGYNNCKCNTDTINADCSISKVNASTLSQSFGIISLIVTLISLITLI
ncbi:predicted protein [Naegleria gruberi]|uniref:leishmanolysin n=1 Tax=Naegleria gruberi TaxID=5762 RepID=D2VZX7_NAEGR|nr:uncharacterized protein NAEGRDRAFT_74654 [Naegleria gruberi]EFC37610.1 predicted protein [Naegleria gruberi]|eukprot:XP_002670354.1 predicted protein [Naegleria gruberi strain NEG-M]